MPEGRHVEVFGSVAPAYGRLYLLTENFLYCLGDKKAAYKGPAPGAPATVMPWPKEAAGTSDQPATSIQVFPTELMVKPGEKIAFEVRAFDAQGRRVKAPAAVFSLNGLTGAVDEKGVFAAAATPVLQAGQSGREGGNPRSERAGARFRSASVERGLRRREGSGPLDRRRTLDDRRFSRRARSSPRARCRWV